MQEFVIMENRFRIFVGILLSSIFVFSLYFLFKIFATPIIKNPYDLRIKEFFIFGSTAFLALIGLIIVGASILFMLYKLLFPAKICINEKGIKTNSKNDFIEFTDIADIKYLSIKNFGKNFIWVWLSIVPMLGFVGILKALQCLLILQMKAGAPIVIQTKEKCNIILPIDESFVDGEEKVIDTLKYYWKNRPQK